jgi:hypothetical protein
MRESRTYGSGRGACNETHVPTATLRTGLCGRPWRMKRMLSWEVAGTEVDRRHGVLNPRMSWTGGTSSILDCANDLRGLEHAL